MISDSNISTTKHHKEDMLKKYLNLSYIYCFAFPIVLLYYGAIWASMTQFFCGFGFIAARLTLHYKRYRLACFLALASSYVAITTQMFLYLPKEAGFHLLYSTIVILAIELFDRRNRGDQIILIAFAVLNILSYFACELYGLELYKYHFHDSVILFMYIASTLGMFLGPVYIFLSATSSDSSKT